MILFSLITTILYAFFIISLIIGFNRVPFFFNVDNNYKTKFTIIIPFRNEAKNLTDLLTSIQGLNYPKSLYEIIFVNDHSEDRSTAMIFEALKKSSIIFQIIENNRISNSPKKDALTMAINKAHYNWIITTDADCKLPEFWLATFDAFIQKNEVSFIAGPVSYYHNNSFLQRFQALDFMSLIGTTIGGFGIQKPFLCNGANLAYRKTFFALLQGFKGNDNLASGDDVFLLEKAFKTKPNQVKFLKSTHAIVLTKPEITIANLISQRVRWASKTSKFNTLFAKFIGLTVLMMNILVISTFMLSFFELFSIVYFSFLFLIKISIDFILLFKTSQFFNNKKLLHSYLVTSILYPFFTVHIAVKALFFSYQWKGRRFSK